MADPVTDPVAEHDARYGEEFGDSGRQVDVGQAGLFQRCPDIEHRLDGADETIGAPLQPAQSGGYARGRPQYP
ncbi:hypothetical protein [Streptosporangium sp. NPDC004631]